uniref:Uncharacterized protein n=1 Tax=viral metagenome TaxID=1070528 RepID=A0A6C0D967_9ZZZZ
MINLYGSIGYTYLESINNQNPRNILLLSDMHSQLSYCSDSIKISDWFMNKLDSNNILLEEVPREDVKLKELFSEAEHTQDLKNMYLNNSDIIHALDIRPFLIPFSWELIELSLRGGGLENSQEQDINLLKYLNLIEDFYNFKHDKVSKYLGEIYNQDYIKNNKYLGSHMQVIYNGYLEYKKNNSRFLNQEILELYNNNKHVLEEINNLLDNIMEYFTIAKIYKLKDNKKNILIHAGLAHTEKILFWLVKLYEYKIISNKGVNNLQELDNVKITNGCLKLPTIIDNHLSTINYKNLN